jgi:hypothetical protein
MKREKKVYFKEFFDYAVQRDEYRKSQESEKQLTIDTIKVK